MPRHSPTPLRHAWNVTPAEARQIQGQLRSRVSHKNGPELRNIRYVAGVDCSLRDSGTLSALANWDPS